MSKKLTYSFVKKSFEKEGYTLLSEEYVNAHTKLNYICPNGHKHSITWANWQTCYRCPYCSGVIKPDIRDIKTAFNKEGYFLLSECYKNAHTKLDYRCVNGHVGSISWKNWKSGSRCNKCSINNRRHSLSFIKNSFKKEGYILLSEKYKNAHTKLIFKCPKGHHHSIMWNDWQQGKRCFYCSDNVKPSYDLVKNSFKEAGYILLSTEYINNNSKLDYVCDKGHHCSMVWGNWKQGNRCPECSGKMKKTIKEVRSFFELEGYTLLSGEYKNNKTKLNYICPLGHKGTIRFYDWADGHRCPVCSHLDSFGAGNQQWRGGKSFELYCEVWKDLDYKKDIRNRDGNKCLNPYCNSKNPNDLTIHHINYDKKDCKPSNLITICRSCNSKANKDRSWHKAWYQAIVNKRY